MADRMLHRRPGPWVIFGTAAPAPSSGRHRRAARSTAFPGRRRVRLGVISLAVAAIVAALVWIVVTPQEAGVAPATTSPAVGAAAGLGPDEEAAATWIRTNLPAHARLLGTGPVAANLTTSGFTVGPGTADWREFSYVITTPTDGALAPARQSSVALALFGDVAVRQIVPRDLAGFLQARAADRTDRQIAGAALLRNPAIATAAPAQAALADGALDMRPATVLAALAGQTQVQLDAITPVPAESAADLPARSISFRPADLAVASAVLNGLSSPYRPSRLDRNPSGEFTAQWPVSLDTVPALR